MPKTDQTSDLTKIRLADHDLLTKLDVKFGDMASDIKELKDGTSHRIALVETRVTLIEKFKDKWWSVLGLASLIGGVIGYIISVLANLSRVFPK